MKIPQKLIVVEREILLELFRFDENNRFVVK